MSLRRRIGNLFFRNKVDREINAELQAHIEMRVEENLAEGMSPEHARRDALIRFGSLTATRERVASMDAALMLDSIWSDIRFSCRQLIRNPGFAATATLVLALGIGASVVIFAFVDAALIKPLPYKDPGRLVSVYEVVNTCPLCNISYKNYLDWKRSNLPFSSIEAWGWASYLMRSPEATEPVQGARVSDGFFRTLGVAPVLGRDFYPGEDKPGSPHTILISYGSWQRRFGSDSGIVGRQVALNNISYTIIGVLPKDFHFAPIGVAAEFWAALNDPNSCDERRGCHGLFGLARLKNGVSLQTAAAAMQTVAQQLAKQYPDSNHGLGATATTLSDSIVGNIRGVLLVLLSGASLLLLIALVNVANLVLVRAERRKRETAVRGALGASTVRLLRQFVTEALVLVFAGSLLALGFAYFGINLLIQLIPAQQMEAMPFLSNLGLNPHACTFAGLLSLLAIVLIALIPALSTHRQSLRRDLADGGRGAAGNAWRRLGSRLIVLELVTAVVLLVGAGLLAKSFYLLLRVDLGFKPDHLATIVVEAPKSYADGDRLMVLERRIVSQIGSLPGVKSAVISSHLPVRNWDGGVWIVVPGRPATEERNDLPERDVSFGYLETLGTHLLSGRYFTEDEDDGDKRRVIVVNQTLARQMFPGENPIGKHLAYKGGQDMEIIGEIEDVKEGPLDTANRPVIYVPFNQDSSRSFYLVVRTSQAEQSLLPTIAAAVHRLDHNLATTYPATMSQVIDDSPSAYLHRASAWLAGSFGGFALLLSVVGLYGVITYSVNQRTREIGVRIALGAARGSVYGLVLGEAGRLIAIGIVAGLLCSVAGAAVMRNLLFGIQPWDAPTLVAVAVSLAIFAMLASFIPARRAASVNPVEALRME